MKTSRIIVLPALVLAAGAWLAAAPRESQAPKAHGIDAIAWLAGAWRESAARGVTEEVWLPPRGGMMLGMNRSTGPGGRLAGFEYLRIVDDGEGVVYLAAPGGRNPTPFRLTKATPDRAVFENPEHDFPKRIEYRLADGKLEASIAGDEPGPSWTFERFAAFD